METNVAGFPQELTLALEALLAGRESTQLERDAKAISENYRMRTGQGNRLLTRESEAAAYATARMPATFAAAHEAIHQALEAGGLAPKTLLDCGAGTGAAAWAAAQLLDNAPARGLLEGVADSIAMLQAVRVLYLLLTVLATSLAVLLNGGG